MNVIALSSTCVWTQCICIWLRLDNSQCYPVCHTLCGTFVKQEHCDTTEWLLNIFLLIVILNYSEGYSQITSVSLTSVCLYFSFFFISDSECRWCFDYSLGKISEGANWCCKGKRPPTCTINNWTVEDISCLLTPPSSTPQYVCKSLIKGKTWHG